MMGRLERDLKEDIRDEKNVVTLEAPPYRGSDLEKYLENLSRLDVLDKVSYMNVCNNPIGRVNIDPLPISYSLLKEYEISPITHLACRNSTLTTIQRWLLGADSLGIDNLLVVSGDSGCGDYENEPTPSYMNSVKIIEGVKRYLNKGKLMPDHSKDKAKDSIISNDIYLDNPTDFTVGGVIIPRRNNEVKYAKKKIDAGVDFLQTQITYDKEHTFDFIKKLGEEVKNCPPILISLRPISSVEDIEYISENIPQVNVPDDVIKRIKTSEYVEGESKQLALDIFDFIQRKVDSESIDVDVGLHINHDEKYRVSKKIIEEVA